MAPASLGPLVVCQSAPDTGLHRCRDRQASCFAPGVTLSTLDLRLASAGLRPLLCRAGPVLRPVASSAHVGSWRRHERYQASWPTVAWQVIQADVASQRGL